MGLSELRAARRPAVTTRSCGVMWVAGGGAERAGEHAGEPAGHANGTPRGGLSLQSEAAAVATETHPQDLQDPLQGPGRARAAGRLLPEPGGLVVPQCAQRGAGDLRVPVERLHQPGGASARGLGGARGTLGTSGAGVAPLCPPRGLPCACTLTRARPPGPARPGDPPEGRFLGGGHQQPPHQSVRVAAGVRGLLFAVGCFRE